MHPQSFILSAKQVHAVLKALPANQQQEKRELDIEAVKEQDGEADDKLVKTDEKTDKDDDTTEKAKTDKDNDNGK